MNELPDRAPTRRRVLVVANSAFYVLNFRAGLLARLAERGFEVAVACPMDRNAAARIHELGGFGFDWRLDAKSLGPFSGLGSFRALQRIVETTDPELVLTFNTKPAVAGCLVGGRRRIPVVATLTGLGSAVLGGRVTRMLARGLLRVALPGARRIVVQNEDDRVWTRSLVPQRAEQVDLVRGSGVDCATIRRAVRARRGTRSAADPFRFVFVGRLLAQKGILELLEAARTCEERGLRFTIDLVGGPGDNQSSLDLDTLRASAPGSVRFVGWRADVGPDLAAADCLVLPSWREGLSRALVEGLAVGLPVLTTDVAGCRDLIRDGVQGFVVPARDPAALADGMARMIELSERRRRRMGREAMLLAREFDADRINDLYVRLVERELPMPAAESPVWVLPSSPQPQPQSEGGEPATRPPAATPQAVEESARC